MTTVSNNQRKHIVASSKHKCTKSGSTHGNQVQTIYLYLCGALEMYNRSFVINDQRVKVKQFMLNRKFQQAKSNHHFHFFRSNCVPNPRGGFNLLNIGLTFNGIHCFKWWSTLTSHQFSWLRVASKPMTCPSCHGNNSEHSALAVKAIVYSTDERRFSSFS